MKSESLLDAPGWVADWVPNIDDERSLDRLRRMVWAVLLAGLLAFVVRGADQPADPFVPSEATEPIEPSDGP